MTKDFQISWATYCGRTVLVLILQDIFQLFLEQLFIRQLWKAAIIYKLSYSEKQSFTKKLFLKIE